MSDTQTVRCTIDRKVSEDIKNIIQLLMLSPKDKKIIINKAGLEVRKISRQHIREGRDIDGRTFEPRKKKSCKKRLLKHFSKGLKVRSNAQKGRARVKWGKMSKAELAYLHQHGISETVKAADLPQKEASTTASEYKPCPRWLAKRILKLKWTHQPSTKRKNSARSNRKYQTVKWIMKNMSRNRALGILYELEDHKPKPSWTIERPKREFLGVTNKESDTILEDIADYALGKR